MFNGCGLGVGGMLGRGFISGSRDLKSRSDCGTRERRGHSGEMVSALRHPSTEVFADTCGLLHVHSMHLRRSDGGGGGLCVGCVGGSGQHLG